MRNLKTKIALTNFPSTVKAKGSRGLNNLIKADIKNYLESETITENSRKQTNLSTLQVWRGNNAITMASKD